MVESLKNPVIIFFLIVIIAGISGICFEHGKTKGVYEYVNDNNKYKLDTLYKYHKNVLIIDHINVKKNL